MASQPEHDAAGPSGNAGLLACSADFFAEFHQISNAIESQAIPLIH